MDCFLYTGTKLYGIQITHARKHNKTHVAVRQMIQDCNGRLLDGLILVDEDDAVSRVSVEMPKKWKTQSKTESDSEKFERLPHAPVGAVAPTLQSANKLNDSSFCQYRWRFKVPSVIDTMVKPETEFIVTGQGSTFRVTPKQPIVMYLKVAIKDAVPKMIPCEFPQLIINGTRIRWWSTSLSCRRLSRYCECYFYTCLSKRRQQHERGQFWSRRSR